MSPISYILNHRSLLLLLVLFVLLTPPVQVSAQSVSNDVTVTAVVDKAPPSVTITNPASNTTVAGTVVVTADASDDAGIARVEFFVDGFLKLTDVTSPYTFSWDTHTTANGAHTVMVIAYDLVGNTATDSIAVTVNNVAPPAPPAPSASQPPVVTEPGTKGPGALRRFFLIDLPNFVLLGPAEGRNSDFLMGFIVAAETSFIFLLLYLIFHRRIRR